MQGLREKIEQKTELEKLAKKIDEEYNNDI